MSEVARIAEPYAPAHVARIQSALGKAHTPEEFVEIEAAIRAIEELMKAAKLDPDWTAKMQEVNEAKMRARWKLGRALAQAGRGQGARTDLTSVGNQPKFSSYLKSIGLNPNSAKVAQAVATIPEDEFERFIEEYRGTGNGLMTYQALIDAAEPWIRPSTPIPRVGGKVAVPEGMTIENMVDKGVATSTSAEEASKTAKMGLGTFRKARFVVMAARKSGLSSKEILKAEYALREMNQSQRVDGPYQTIRPIVERVWGKINNKTLEQAEKKRLAEFDRATATIAEICKTSDKIPIPATGQKIADTLAEMKRAQCQLRSFIRKLEDLQC
tara:strand:+ start:114 stop:1094 length:981 start_codon:yes stop_codon:yes gene_type:complete